MKLYVHSTHHRRGLVFSNPFTLLSKLLFWRRLRKRNGLAYSVIGIILIIIIGIYAYSIIFPANKTEAAWFNNDWAYRQRVNISNSGSLQTDYQIRFFLNTSSLISAGKMKADCSDLRITDINGNQLPFWVENTVGSECNTSSTSVWVKIPSIPTSGVYVFLYYGNPVAKSVASGKEVFDLFDDFDGTAVDTTLWTGNTSNFTVSGGTLQGSDTTYRLQSKMQFTGSYEAITRTYVTTQATNGHMPIGFYASTTNSFGILAHATNAWYYRNDSSWVSLTGPTQGQWIRINTKVAGTSASYGLYGETSTTSNSSQGITNSGLSSEAITIGLRYDGCCTGQTYDADWDWIAVRKAAATEPGIGSPTNEEKSPAPVGYWRFDEGNGTTANDNSSNRNNGTITNATWQTDDQCIVGKCLYFTSTNNVTIADPANQSLDFGTGDFTISTWVRTGTSADNRNLIRKGAASGLSGFRFGFSGGVPNVLIGDTDNYAEGNLGSTSLADNQWHLLTVVFNRGSNAVAYIDGKQTGTLTISGVSGSIDNASSVIIGNSFATYTGFLDEVKMYNYARSEAQILADYNSPGSGSPTGSGSVLGSSNQSTLTNGLIAYWKMEETSWTNNCSTSTVTDSSGNNNNGTSCPNGTGPNNNIGGKFGKAGNFDGVDDYVNVATSVDIPHITVSAWIKTSTSTTQYITERSNSSYYFATGVTSGKVCLYLAGASPNWFCSNTTVTDGNWHYVTGTYNGSTKDIYVDGVLDASTTGSGNITDGGSNAIQIGVRNNAGSRSGYFNGQIDELRIYNRGLSGNEVNQLYSYGQEPLVYLNMEEGTGTTLKDTASNTYNATLTPGTKGWGEGRYGSGLSQDGISTAAVISTNIPIASYSAEIWIKPEKANEFWKGILGKPGRNYSMWLGNADGSVAGQPNHGYIHHRFHSTAGTNDGCGDSGYYVPFGQWTHVAIVNDGTTCYTYINGSATATTAVNRTLIADTGTTYIGRSPDGGASYFRGNLDEVRIYNYARTAQQVIEDMNAGHPPGGSPIGSAVAYWKFDEGSGTTANNSGSKGNIANGTLSCQGAGCFLPEWKMDGKVGRALRFDSTNTNNNPTVTLTPSTLNGLRNLGDVTISAWINPSSSNVTTAQAVLRNGQGADLEYSMFYDATNKRPYFHWYDGSFQAVYGTANSVPYDTWSHVTIVRSGTTLSFYVNGKLTNSGTVTAPTVNAGQLSIGRTNNVAVSQDYSGYIDEMKIFNYALTADQVKITYNANSAQVLGSLSDTSGLTGGSVASNSAAAAYCVPGSTASCASPIAIYDFDEKQGTTTADKSGNGFSGTLSGAVWNKGGLYFPSNGNNVTISGMTGRLGSTLTVEAWVDYKGINTNGFDRVVTRGWVGNGWLLGVYDSGGDERIMFGIAQSSVQYNAGKIGATPGKLHLVGVYDGATVYLYINGALVSSNTSAPDGATLDTSSSIVLANSLTNPIWIDSVRIYDYARSQDQIAWDYNKGKALAWWKADECMGSTLNDSSGNGTQLSVTIGASGSQTSVGTCNSSSTAWYNGINGKINYSLNFDGTDDYASMTPTSILNTISTDTTPMTISAWVKRSSTGTSDIIFNKQQNTTNQFYYNLRVSSSDVAEFDIGKQNVAASNLSGTSTLSSGQWYHIVGTFDGTTQKIYVNGKLENTRTKNASIASSTANTANLYMGMQYNSTNFFGGQIDDGRIFNYALSEVQVKNLYKNGSISYSPVTGAP